MAYNILKIIHILSAALLLTNILYIFRLWRQQGDTIERIQLQTWLGVIPFALLQLLTGFTIISIKQYNVNTIWVMASAMGFILFILAWFAFMYSLSTASRRTQAGLFVTTGLTLLFMLFFMATRLTGEWLIG